MTWVKLDDSLFARADFRALGRDAKLLYLASLAHTSSQLTDGRVSKPDLAVVAAQAGVKPSVRKELEPDWWAPDEDGWTVLNGRGRVETHNGRRCWRDPEGLWLACGPLSLRHNRPTALIRPSWWDPNRRRKIPVAVKQAVWDRDGGRCVNCGATDHVQYDHIMPVSLGGDQHHEDNLQLLCRSCNARKAGKHPDEWAAQRTTEVR